MFAEIITIGDEILIGQIVDTNSAYIAQELNKIGISVYQISSVQDHREHILQALEEACSRADLILITGGLGPTKDDITKHTLCEFLQDTLVLNKEVLSHVEYLFEKYITTPISEMNRQQAFVPSRATILPNKYGTAPGMWMHRGKQVLVSMPGVPFEMKNLMQHEVLPRIQEQFHRPFILHRTIMTYGLGESAIVERIEDWENALPQFIKLAYLPNLGKVRLRLTAKGSDKEKITEAVDTAIQALYGIIGDIIYGEEEAGSLESGIAKIMTKKGLSLATAESFTGGKIAQQLTSIPGASAYFKGSVVGYATEVKKEVLGVPEDLIKKHTVVSEEVAKSMALQARKLFKADFAISTTGNAGPTKGDSDVEIGTVFIGIATPNTVFAEQFSMGNHRVRIVQKSVHKAFELLKKEILKI
ncbi:competence/damage-inducible protein A [Flavobacteriaceae bacterium D16]|nr:competence/damage-inducible protein A [Flavobacteriaceae bacterium D16]